jgi:hypothetical protein
MKSFRAVLVIVIVAILPHAFGSADAGALKVFFLEDAAKNQWCAFSGEAAWNAAVQEVGSMTVGSLSYTNGHISQIDVTVTDESGDWIVYDRYTLDNDGQLAKLLRKINVQPGDETVLQTFSISGAKARKMKTTAKSLSTGRPLSLTKSTWLPELPVQTNIKMFQFSDLLGYQELGSSGKSCVSASARR